MLNRDSATRAEREIFAGTVVLDAVFVGIINGNGRADRGISQGKTADLACRGHISFQQQRRYGEDVANIVEAISRIIGRKQLVGVDIDREQVTNGIREFGAVE